MFAVGHPALTLHARRLAATLALGPGAVLSHRATGALWEILPTGKPLDVTVAPATGRGDREGIRVHRQRLQKRDRATPRHPGHDAAAHPARSRRRLDRRALGGAFEEPQVRHRLSPALVAAELVAHPGRRGAGNLRPLLAAAVEPGQVESILELRFLRLCATRGLRAR